MLNLIPYPRKVISEGKEKRPIANGIKRNDFALFGVKAFVQRTGIQESESKDAIQLIRKNEMPINHYELLIDKNNIEIHASSEKGIINGLTSLYLLTDEQGEVPCCHIEDWPRMEHRGLLLDCARHFFTAEEVMKIIEGISLAKINVLHWHLSDDQGWRIESKKYPLLQEVSGEFYTQDQIKNVVEFASYRNVEIIPEIDLPGHTSAILAAYPQYSCRGNNVRLAESGGIYRTILCAGKETVYQFLDELLTEVSSLFPSPMFHVGGDEAPKNEWTACSDCQKKMQELHINSLDDLQGYFTSRVEDILKRNGKTIICWNDTLKAKIIPNNLEIQYWNIQYAAEMRDFVKKGKLIYSDMFELYLDYPYSMIPMKRVYECIPSVKGVDLEQSLIGMEACLWSEHLTNDESLENRIFPRICALAENAWSEKNSYQSFLNRLPQLITKAKRAEIQCTPSDHYDPKGKTRQNETFAYFELMNSAMDPETRSQTVESAKPNADFAKCFAKKFFKFIDYPKLLKSMKKSST